MFALCDTREYSFTQVPYLDGEEKDNWPKELRYNVIVNLSPRNRIHSKNTSSSKNDGGAYKNVTLKWIRAASTLLRVSHLVQIVKC